MMNKILIFCLYFFSVSLIQAQELISTPSGKYYSEDDCASGGPTYYFFSSGTVLVDEGPSESQGYYFKGTWKKQGTKLLVQLTKEYHGKPTGNIVPPCGNVCWYDEYTPTSAAVSETRTISLKNYGDDCTEWAKNPLKSDDIHDMLRKSGSKYDYLSYRKVSEQELGQKSKKELRLMRNSIFARYGRIFKSKDLKTYFGQYSWYNPRYKTVTAYLSKLESANIKAIQKVEKSK